MWQGEGDPETRAGCASQMGYLKQSPSTSKSPAPLSLEAERDWFEAWNRPSRLAPCCLTLSSEVCPILYLFLYKTWGKNLSHSIPIGWTLDYEASDWCTRKEQLQPRYLLPAFPEQPLSLAGGDKTWKRLLGREAMTGGVGSLHL